jgi:hypothetical protein
MPGVRAQQKDPDAQEIPDNVTELRPKHNIKWLRGLSGHVLSICSRCLWNQDHGLSITPQEARRVERQHYKACKLS